MPPQVIVIRAMLSWPLRTFGVSAPHHVKADLQRTYAIMKNQYQLPSEPILSKAFLEKGIDDIVLWDVIKLKRENKIQIKFQSENSEWDQGVLLMSNLGFKVNCELHANPIEIWFNDKNKFELTCYSDNGLLHVYNIWNRGKRRESQSWTSGMRISQRGNIRLYRCNDIGYSEKFDNIIFSVTIL